MGGGVLSRDVFAPANVNLLISPGRSIRPWAGAYAHRSRAPSHVSFAFLAEGRLFLKVGDAPPRALTSAFGEASFARDPSGPEITPPPDGGPPRIVIPRVERVYFTGVTRGAEPGELVYSLYTGAVTAICALSASGDERRIVHAASAQLSQVVVDPLGGRLVAASRDVLGGHIVLFRADGREKRILTSDDGIDSEPCFEHAADGPPRAVLFHRQDRLTDREGYTVDLALASVWRVDLESGEETVVAPADERECVSPKSTPDGARYHLRIPLVYPPLPNLWARTVAWLRGGFLAGWDASAARLGFEPPAFALPQAPPLPAFVADDRWELVRTVDGVETVVAKRVLAYDVGTDGRVLITDGRVVRRLGVDGVASSPLAEAEGITLVVALGDG